MQTSQAPSQGGVTGNALDLLTSFINLGWQNQGTFGILWLNLSAVFCIFLFGYLTPFQCLTPVLFRTL